MHVGELVADRFLIEAIAGAGGMGSVFRARDQVTGELVAVKTLTAVGESDAARFAREAAVLAELVHPGIVRYVAHDVSPRHGPYLVMEWLAGETLSTRLARCRLSVDECVGLTRSIAQALATAHARGIVHRDLKPANIMLPANDLAAAKLVDFGIARHVLAAGMLTNTGALVGTPGYMAPEQVRGDHSVDARSDVFSLGCVLYRCLTGAPAFPGESLAVLAKVLLHEVTAPSTLRPEVPPALDALVMRMLAKEAGDRPVDAAAVAQELACIGAVVPCDAPVGELPPTLTASEERLISLVMAAPSEAAATALARAASAFGGRFERIARDAALVVFDASDHAERAARCALAVRSSIAIAVTSGRANVQRLPIGELIDRAAAILGELAPGQIGVDEATAGALDERFVVQRQLRGRRLLRAMREDGEPARTLLGRQTPLVGRDRELATLESVWTECVAESVARVVLVTAPPGAGKSRLRQELMRRVLRHDEHTELLLGRGDVLRAGSPFAVLADAIRRTAGIREGDPRDQQRECLRARIARVLPEGEDVAHLLGEIAGIEFPSHASEPLRAARAEPLLKADVLREAWLRWLVAETAHHPLLIVLDDLHWGDRPSIEYIDLALRELAERPLMVAAFARPEVHVELPGLWHQRALQEIRLPPLTRKAGERLVRELLGEDVAAPTMQRIVERAAGNAFFLEELIRAEIAGAERGSPESVLAILQLRLDQLAPEPKRTLRAASVFGKVFWRAGVAALLGADPDLEVLVERELIVSLGGRDEYAFRHDLVREAAYATMSAADRELGHRLGGRWLAAQGLCDALGLANHFSLGGELAIAAGHFAQAAEQALAGNDQRAAIAHAARGLECGASGELAGRLYLVQAEANNWRGEHALTLPIVRQALDRLAVGSSAWFAAQDELMFALGRLGEPAAAVLREIMETNALPGGELAQIRSLARAAILMFRFGSPHAASGVVVCVEQLAARAAVDISTQQRLHAVRAFAARARGDVEAAVAEHTAAIAGYELTRNQRELAFAELARGGVFDEIGDPDRALPLLERALAIADKLGIGSVAMIIDFQIAMCEWQRGRLAEARTAGDRALAKCGEHDRGIAAYTRFVLANVALERGELAEAERHAELGVELAAQFAEYRSLALAASARIALHRGNAAAALERAREARQRMPAHDGFEYGESYVRLVEIEALDAMHDVAAARVATAEAVARLHERAARIAPEWRQRFLARREHAATLSRL